MTALDTWGFAQKQRPSPRCGSRWDQLRCIADELLSPGWSLHWHVELLRSVVLRASVSGRSRWSRGAVPGPARLHHRLGAGSGGSPSRFRRASITAAEQAETEEPTGGGSQLQRLVCGNVRHTISPNGSRPIMQALTLTLVDEPGACLLMSMVVVPAPILTSPGPPRPSK